MFLTLAAGGPGFLQLALYLSGAPVPRALWWGLAVASPAWVLLVALIARVSLLRNVRTLTNLVEMARSQDYGALSARAREPGELGELYRQFNALIQSLKESRQTEQELLGMLEKVVDHINVAIIVCDSYDRIRLVNTQACRLLHSDAAALVGKQFTETPLADIPFTSEHRLIDHRFPAGEGRWQVGQQTYRQQGRPSRILFISDLKQVLSAEQASAWQRLIRVISHEVNNSLTPIMSLCQTLATILERSSSPEHIDDVRENLSVIAERARGLKEFITAYARITRLPESQMTLFHLEQLINRLTSIFAPAALEWVGPVPDIQLFGDPVQLEQALINLVKNALEAAGGEAPSAQMRCAVKDGFCEFEITDSGSGISNTNNLFVPFYTTKPDGSGVGLALTRQIADRHYGEVTLGNRADGRGAVARLVLPLPTVKHSR